MDIAPLRLFPVEDGRFALEYGVELNASADMVQELGHEPNGEFWLAIAQLHILESVPELDGKIDFDPEAGAFLAYADDEAALMRLAQLMAKAVNDPAEVKAVFERAERAGIEFDD